MNIQFTTAESAFCPRLRTREGHEEHITQPHLPISSLPSPRDPLEISHFPIAITSETAKFNPKNIANLWLQLLIIQIQNANFWNYDDVLKLQADKTYQRSLAARKAANPDPSETIKDHQVKKWDSKACKYVPQCLVRDGVVTGYVLVY